MDIAYIIALFILAYVAGSIPIGFVLGKTIRKIDIREHGSGNVGATNVMRVLGWKLGLVALFFDMMKGLIVVLIAKANFSDNSYIILGSGITAILGHIFSLFLKFKGGKGVATSAGVFIAITPHASAIAISVFIVVVIITKYVSAGSILAALALIISQLVITLNHKLAGIEYLIVTIVVAFFIIYKHKSNIGRLINGTENKLSFTKKTN